MIHDNFIGELLVSLLFPDIDQIEFEFGISMFLSEVPANLIEEEIDQSIEKLHVLKDKKSNLLIYIIIFIVILSFLTVGFITNWHFLPIKNL